MFIQSDHRRDLFHFHLFLNFFFLCVQLDNTDRSSAKSDEIEIRNRKRLMKLKKSKMIHKPMTQVSSCLKDDVVGFSS